MQDRNGKTLDVGDLVWTSGRTPPTGTAVIEDINTLHNLFPDIYGLGGYCVRCGANAVAYWSKLNSYSCGCVLLKISPDENQFEDETNKDLDKELVRV